MENTSRNKTRRKEAVPIRFHPRVFAALGADLVTSDVVAIIELVKNSYDAFARNVWITFAELPDLGACLEIKDDGIGMTRDIIIDVWCLVATPYKAKNPTVQNGKHHRRVSGEKGLGRLSAARLGKQLQMITQQSGSQCIELNIDWEAISNSDSIDASHADIENYGQTSPFKPSGTLLRIQNLRTSWGENEIKELEDNLARLLSPFAKQNDFNIFLSNQGQISSEVVRIESPTFLSFPKYSIEGAVDVKGNVEATYTFNPIQKGKKRTVATMLTWEQVFDQIQNKTRYRFSPDGTSCGPFQFEIRAWDVGPDDTGEIAEKYGAQKSLIRKAIGAHKGISVYRDGILVLPKSETAKDWLGLDLRRVSKVGTRMSTSQLVGYVSISAEKNPGLLDTSDRERLVSSIELGEFEELLMSIVGLLAVHRDNDRTKKERHEPMKKLFGELSAEKLIDEIELLADEGAAATDVVPLIQSFSDSLDSARREISERFVYYSRMATIGTIAQMLVHEIRNRTISFGTFLTFVKNRFGPFNDKEIQKQYLYAENSVIALERLADTFAPLASRSFARKKRDCVLEERIGNCVDILGADLERKHIRVSIPKSTTRISVDPGELEAVILNLFTNSIYWLGQVDKESREIQVKVSSIESGKRTRVWLHDSGPGIADDLVERVLLPGVTQKPGGIGMGLTVASEIVADNGGELTIKQPGTLGGASIGFDLPNHN